MARVVVLATLVELGGDVVPWEPGRAKLAHDGQYPLLTSHRTVLRVPERVTAKSNGAARKASKNATSWSPTKDLNFWPADKVSITDFATQKQPSTQQEKSTVLLYWFKEIAEKEEVNPGDILAGYRECSWPMPGNIANQLEVTASTKGWLVSKNKSDLRLTTSGDNLVRRNLPKTGKKWSSRPRLPSGLFPRDFTRSC